MFIEHDIIKFTKKGIKPQNPNYYLISYKESQGIFSLFNHLIQNTQHLVFVMIDNKDRLWDIANAIGYFDPSIKVMQFNSDLKSDKDFINLISKEKISDDVRVVLTTRVMADGANIRNLNVDAVYFYNVIDPILKRQFIGRMRNGVRNIYDFVKSVSEDEEKKPFPIVENNINEFHRLVITMGCCRTKSKNRSWARSPKNA